MPIVIEPPPEQSFQKYRRTSKSRISGPLGVWNFPVLNGVSRSPMGRQQLGTIINGELGLALDRVDDIENYVEGLEGSVRDGDLAAAVNYYIPNIRRNLDMLDQMLRNSLGKGKE